MASNAATVSWVLEFREAFAVAEWGITVLGLGVLGFPYTVSG